MDSFFKVSLVDRFINLTYNTQYNTKKGSNMRSETVIAKVTKEEKELIEMMAQKDERTASDIIRRAIHALARAMGIEKSK